MKPVKIQADIPINKQAESKKGKQEQVWSFGSKESKTMVSKDPIKFKTEDPPLE